MLQAYWLEVGELTGRRHSSLPPTSFHLYLYLIGTSSSCCSLRGFQRLSGFAGHVRSSAAVAGWRTALVLSHPVKRLLSAKPIIAPWPSRGRRVILSSRLRSFPASFHLLVLSLTLLSDSFSRMNIPVFQSPEASLHSLPWDLISPAVSANYYVPCPSDNANVSAAPV